MCLQLYILVVLYYCIVVTVWMYCIEANDCQSRWKVRKSGKRGAINNSRSFEWTDVGSNSTNIWVEWETIILLPSQFPPALLINWPCLYSQGLLRSSGSHNENKKVIKTIELRYVFKWRIWSHKASWWDSK